MPDIVYVLGSGSRWKDNEIRYSLRSIEKYVTGYDHVFIVGRCPSWVKDIVFIECEDVIERKELSIRNKILAACNDDRVSDDFVLFNDDHFTLRPIDVRDIRYWYSITLQAKASVALNSNRTKAYNTLEVLPGESYFYDIHVPILYNKEEFKTVLCDPILNWKEKDYFIKTLYGNKALLNRAVVYMKDCKIGSGMGYDAIMQLIEDRTFFSIGPGGIKSDMKRVLQTLYPDKSRFEQ